MAVIGIDLGTTNSLAACWREGRPCLIPDESGNVLLPSVVSRTEEGTYLVGQAAKELLYSKAERTAGSFKRFMGTEKSYSLAGAELTPVELSALVLQRIRKNAEYFLKEEIDEAVITVPAYFNDRQRADTKKAAQIAGLPVERLINEPSAAALAYRQLECGDAEGSEGLDMNLIVFDFGGGTLDLSYVECFDNIIEILAVTGDNRLGGDDIDDCIAAYFCRENGIELSALSPNEHAALRREAEQAKLALGRQDEVELAMGGRAVALNEDRLFQICMPLFERIKKLMLKLLKDSDMRISDIDALVMVGGSSKLLVVQRFLTELLGKVPVVLGDTDQVVAMGAGVYAGIRQRKEEIRDLLLTDVCPFSLGIEVGEHGQMFSIIARNATLPAHYVEHFVTLHDYQSQIAVKVYQGEEYYVKDNLFLTSLEIPVPSKRAGVEGVDVHFTYDINGILHVEVVNSRGEHNQVVLANRDLTESQLAHYRRTMEALELPPIQQPENKLLLDKLAALYEEGTTEQRSFLGALIERFMRALESGRLTDIRRVTEEVRKTLEHAAFSDEWQEELRFDGEMKLAAEAEDDSEHDNM